MTTKKLKVGNVPNLRFPEFEGEWETKKLGEIGEIVTGSTPPTNDESYYGGEHLFVSPADIQTNRYVKNSKTTLTSKGFKKGRKIKKGSSLFVCIGSTIGKVAQASEDCVTNQQINAIVSLEHNVDFVFSLLEFNSKKIKMLSAEQAVPIINKTTFSNVKINVPLFSEQAKIASFLSLIDERIQTQNKILLHYQSLIKNLRNGIFKQKIRFKNAEGDNFSDWNIVELGSIAKKINTKNKEMAIKTVLSNSATFGIMNQSDFFDKEIANPNNINGYYIVEKDDFVYNPRISKEAPVGPISRNKVGVGVISPLYMVFRFREGDIDYLEHFFNSDTWFGHMENIANYGARADRMSFSSSDFSKMLIPVPEIREQIRIASFLSNIDQKIQIEKAILKQLEHQKQSLLKQMFV